MNLRRKAFISSPKIEVIFSSLAALSPIPCCYCTKGLVGNCGVPSVYQNNATWVQSPQPKLLNPGVRITFKTSNKLTGAGGTLQECTCCQQSLARYHPLIQVWFNEKMFASPRAANEWRGGGGGPQEQPRGLKFPTPGVVLWFGLHLASSASLHGGTLAIHWQTWHQTREPDCSRWINVTWIKSRNEWPGLLQLGPQPMSELIGLSKKEPC